MLYGVGFMGVVGRLRYLVRFVCVLAGLVASPLSASAQAGEEGATSEPNLKEHSPSFEPDPEDLKGSVPSSEPASEEPALQLQLDSAGVEVVPSPPRTADGYTLEEMDVRVRRAMFGIVGSAVAVIVGGTLVMTGVGGDCGWGGDAERQKCDRRAYAGTALAAGGAVGMITAGILLGVRKRNRRSLQEADYGRPHRAQWDLARSRLEF